MGDDFKLDVLKQALKTQRSEAQQREEALQNQLNGLWQRADKERKLLLGQVNELKGELARRGSPKTPSSWDLDGAAAPLDDAGGGMNKYKINTLEAKVQAQQLEMAELREMAAERDAAVSRQQQRNGTLTAKIEERDQQAQVERLAERLRHNDAFAPPAWITGARGERDRERGGEAAMMQGASGRNNWHQDEDFVQGELILGYVGAVGACAVEEGR
ncbi:hypothetical protein T484DRAFT_1777215 [Baffinella frigidus]|nr:hypothetical protein T484DRAFT_1777215 [Cryptophyta sp. CCMP2293]